MIRLDCKRKEVWEEHNTINIPVGLKMHNTTWMAIGAVTMNTIHGLVQNQLLRYRAQKI